MRNKYYPSFSQHNSYIKSQTLRVGKTTNQLKQTHIHSLKTLTKPQYHNFLTQFLTHLLELPGDNLSYAHHVFDQIPNCKNQFVWTALIRANVMHSHFSQSIDLYAKMQRTGVSPSGFTFSSVLNACARLPAISQGNQIHKRLVQSGFLGNKIVQTALLDMYAKFGCVLDARYLFDMMGEKQKDVVAWTAMICGYTKLGMMDDAQRLFETMRERNVVSWSAMVAGYAHCGKMKEARDLFDEMLEKNPVTWVAMISGYGKCGDVNEARRVFDQIEMRDASCWAAIVACYAQNAYAREAIEMYKAMREEKVMINEVAMVGAVSACTQLGDIEMATTLHRHVEEGCWDKTVFVSNALINMHAKCGCMELAWREFDRMKERDVISYSTMITALGEHGESQKALDLFIKMLKEGIKPNQVTFIGVLNACSSGGLVEEGCQHFELMTQNFDIQPLTEHLTCMVDLLGRAGQLEKTYDFMMKHVGALDAGIWGALLGACKVHSNTELGEIAAKRLFKIEPDNTGNYVLLANTYASMGKWDDAERIRKIMNERGMRKSVGCSWIPSLRQT
ncbi:PPR domain-containing protein/PPR_2 domain-containing protein [Cephalotus follicularis]|uniref:PPR domain-containing protein/PPR_2 domain-containing protein n=1 Tax=Cephalotus follicularis TaxID=3775 RepID=A0A1Q3C1Z7_CEPFO|nr:PPR domain-containing protein/PPR_2 domain-containing protein [Cephalotus follicularis]